MTNSDRLQEIRERAARAVTTVSQDGKVVAIAHPAISGDALWLLQLVTEQQREIDRARRTVSNLVGGMCDHKESCQYPNCECGK